jgi:TPR repeat protein
MHSHTSSSSSSSSSSTSLEMAFANQLALQAPTQTAMVDLHGLSEVQAKSAVNAVIENARSFGWNDIRIVTGRGNHVNAKGKRGTLYNNFKEWIKEVSSELTDVQQFDGYYEVTIKENMSICNPLQTLLNDNIKKFLTKNIAAIIEQAKSKKFDDLHALAICLDNAYGVNRDYKKAAELYLEMLKIKQDPLILYEMGCRHLIGKGVECSDAKAIHYFTLSADLNYVLAEFTVGNMYWKGIGLPKPDYILGNKYLRKAAEHNHAESARKLGWSFRNGLGVEINIAEAIKWWEKAEKLDDPVAAYNLYCAYEQGREVTKDSPRALYYLQRAADLGDPDAQFIFGMRCLFGWGVTVIKESALTYINAAAGNGSINAQYFLFMLALKNGEEKEAIRCLMIAAENDHIEAQVIVVFDEAINLEQPFRDLMKTKLLAQSEADILKMDNKRFQNRVIQLLIGDDSTKNHIKKGIKILKHLAEAGQTELYSVLGESYMWGIGGTLLPASPQAGFDYWKLGADKGDAECLCSIGQCFRDGLGRKKDIAKAIEYFQASIAKNHPNAHYELGNAYLSGKLGISKDVSLAVEHFNKAMELSKPSERSKKAPNFISHQVVFNLAAYNLGCIYYYGDTNFPQDTIKGVNYFIDAAEDGSKDAARFLFEYYFKTGEQDKLFFYTKIAAKLGYVNAQNALTSLMSQPFAPHVVSYNLADKVRIDEPKVVTLLKEKSKLPFFAVRDKKIAKVDAVVACNTEAEFAAVLNVNASSVLRGKACFFYNGKSQPRLFVLHNVDNASFVTRYLRNK